MEENLQGKNDLRPPLQIGRSFSAYRDINKAIEKHRELFGVRLALKRAVKLENYSVSPDHLKDLNLKLKYGELDYHCFLDTGRPGRPGNGGRCPQLVRLKLSPDAQTLAVYESHMHGVGAVHPAEDTAPPTVQPSMDMMYLTAETSICLKGDIAVTPIGPSRKTPVPILPKPTSTSEVHCNPNFPPLSSPYGNAASSKNISPISSLNSTTITPISRSLHQSPTLSEGGQEKITLKIKKSPYMPNEMVVVNADALSKEPTDPNRAGAELNSSSKKLGDHTPQCSPHSYEPLNSLAIVSTPGGSLNKLQTYSESSAAFSIPNTPIPKKKYDKDSPHAGDQTFLSTPTALEKKSPSSQRTTKNRLCMSLDSQPGTRQMDINLSDAKLAEGFNTPPSSLCKPPLGAVSNNNTPTNIKQFGTPKSADNGIYVSPKGDDGVKILNDNKSSLPVKLPNLSRLSNLPNSTTVTKSELKSTSINRASEFIDLTNSPIKPKIPNIASNSITITKKVTKFAAPSNSNKPFDGVKSVDKSPINNKSSSLPVIVLDSEEKAISKAKPQIPLPPSTPKDSSISTPISSIQPNASNKQPPMPRIPVARSLTPLSSGKSTPPGSTGKPPGAVLKPSPTAMTHKPLAAALAAKPISAKSLPTKGQQAQNLSSHSRLSNSSSKAPNNLKSMQDIKQGMSAPPQKQVQTSKAANGNKPAASHQLSNKQNSSLKQGPPSKGPYVTSKSNNVTPTGGNISSTTASSIAQNKSQEKADRNGGGTSQKSNDRVLQPKAHGNIANGVSQTNSRIPNVKRIKKKPGRYPDSGYSNNSSQSGTLDTELGYGEKQHLAHNVLLQLLRVTSQLPMVEFSHALETLELLTDAFKLGQRVSLTISRDQEDICPPYLNGYPDVQYAMDEKESKVSSTTDDVQMLDSQIDGEVDADSFLQKLDSNKATDLLNMKVDSQGGVLIREVESSVTSMEGHEQENTSLLTSEHIANDPNSGKPLKRSLSQEFQHSSLKKVRI